MSQASPSKEPSMDEILASIRRIIESSDEKTGTGPAAAAARIAAADRAALARDASSDRPATFTLPVPAARVVPFSDRTTAAAHAPEPAATDDADERWMPLTEPANAAGEPPVSAFEDPSASLPTETVAAPSVEPVAASDRWARELDDVETWSVLDTPAAPADEPAAPAEEEVPTEAKAFAPEPVSSEPVSSEAVSAEAVFGKPVLGEPVRADDVSPEDATSERRATDVVVEPDIATIEPAEADDDFMVDFDEADFVEALDRNAALVSVREEATDAVPASSAVDEARAPAALPSIEAIERSVLPAFFASQAPLPSAAAAAARPSVMQQTSALMSEEAGTQVAAAFDDLARVIRDGQMKSMEDIARGMLRPMLQEWLDDNLPRLVERLVREEIERVSRGPSR